MKIIIGLGNLGEKYIKTRHNFGFMVIDHFAQQHGMEFTQKKFKSFFSKKLVNDEEVVLLKPQTYMNVSGAAVKDAVDMYKCDLQNILVICDDMDLPLGKIRLRSEGGCGGHRGLESISSYLGTSNFSRLRVGIGHPDAEDPSGYVLSSFSKEEEVPVGETIERACMALRTWISEGIDVCMNKFN